MILNSVISSGGDVNKSQIIVTAETGSIVTCSKGGTVKYARELSGKWRFTGIDNGTWTVTATKNNLKATKTVKIERLTVEYVKIAYRNLPEFTYSGDYELVDDNDKILTNVLATNWKLRLLSTGVLTVTEPHGWDMAADLFLVGGGSGSTGYAGGAGGKTFTAKNVKLEKQKRYTIDIGAGGSPAVSGGQSQRGGTTKISALSLSADGGGYSESPYSGAPGGSGGGSYGNTGSASNVPNGNLNGGSNGGRGGTINTNYPGGAGQESTTREFGEPNGKLYAGGGGGRYSYDAANVRDGKGGEGGGGDAGSNGAKNTGGGAGAGFHLVSAHSGGSGIVIIRNRREAAV